MIDYSQIRDWLDREGNLDLILTSLIAALASAFVVWIVTRTWKRLLLLYRSIQRRLHVPFREAIVQYRECLDSALFLVQHSWMKEGQTLRDILVPVNVVSPGIPASLQRLNAILSAGLATGDGHAQRLVLLGAPGSGKTVALRVAAHQSWTLRTIDESDTLIPILFTFAQYREAGLDLVETITRTLRACGFQSGTGAFDAASDRSFVEQTLPTGRFFLLVDALDELAESTRGPALGRLASDLRRFRNTPALITCRAEAWKSQLDVAGVEVLHMAEFTSSDIRQFIQKWPFEPPKSPEGLLLEIRTQPHVQELVRNPLLLTIVTFLYFQPRYRLPSNRAHFYETCVRVLLEHWDHSSRAQRTNMFSAAHKEDLLARLAYSYFCGHDPDGDIPEAEALAAIGNGMDTLGLRRAENAALLREIVENSGLLVHQSASTLRYPHRTFVEYFAATYMLRYSSPQTLLSLYARDPGRWREVLLLYSGLTRRPADSLFVISQIIETAPIELAVAALVDASTVDAGVVSRVLSRASEALDDAPSKGLIESLGHLASSERMEYADAAYQLLKRRLATASKLLDVSLLQSLIVACTKRPTEDAVSLVVKHAEVLALSTLLPDMGEDALGMSSTILDDPRLSAQKKLEWIEGLRQAGAAELLVGLLRLPRHDEGVRQAEAMALVRCSNSQAFFELLDRSPLAIPDVDRESVIRVSRKWGWPFSRPLSKEAGLSACWLAIRLSQGLRRERIPPAVVAGEEVDHRVLYLALALYGEQSEDIVSLRLGPPLSSIRQARASTLRSIWHKSASISWNKWMDSWANESNALFTALLYLMAMCVFFLFVQTVVTLVSQILGFGHSGLRCLLYSFVGSCIVLLDIHVTSMYSYTRHHQRSLVLSSTIAVLLTCGLAYAVPVTAICPIMICAIVVLLNITLANTAESPSNPVCASRSTVELSQYLQR